MPEAKMQPDLFERLKSTLVDTPINLADYVRELELYRQEEDIFRRLAFENVSYGGVGTGPFVVSVVSELYEPLDAARKIEIRRWWHEKARQEASQSDDLRTRLSKIS